ncbi:MAG: PEP-CTERM sorting domain-containing protein, partial [Oxalobacteraceae bacterium]
ATALPEPASWALMIGGFGMVGGTLRRRRARVQFA